MNDDGIRELKLDASIMGDIEDSSILAKERFDKNKLDSIREKSENMFDTKIKLNVKTINTKKANSGIKVKSSLDNSKDAKIDITTINWDCHNVDEIVDKMLQFCETMFLPSMRPYQVPIVRRIFEAFLKNEGCILTVVLPRQSGKDELLARALLTLLILIPSLSKIFPEQLSIYERGLKIGIFAPVNEQAYTLHSRMQGLLDTDLADEILADQDLDAKKKYSGGLLQILGPNGRNGVPIYKSFCRIQTSAKQAKIESKTYDLVVVSECQEADSDKVKKSILPMTANTNGLVVMSGTPAPYTSYFYETIQKNMVKDFRNKVKRYHFQYDYKEVMKYNKFYRAHIENMKRELGEDSDAFRMSYKLEWLIEEGKAITPTDFEEYMMDQSAQLEYSSDNRSIYVAGLDFARVKDYTILTIAKLKNPTLDIISSSGDTEKHIVNWLEMRGDAWEQIVESIIDQLLLFKVRILTCDSTGAGDPIVSMLENRLYDKKIDIKRVVFNEKVKNDMAILFLNEVKARRIKIPYHPKVLSNKKLQNFMTQLYAVDKKYNKNLVEIVTPNKKRIPDDYIQSLLMLVYGSRTYTLPYVQEERGNIFFNKTDKITKASLYEYGMEKYKSRIAAIIKKSIEN